MVDGKVGAPPPGEVARKVSSSRSAIWVGLGLLLGLIGSSHAAPFDDLFTDEKNWTEVPPSPPNPVSNPDLVNFYVSPASSFRFSVDAKSITLGKDGVVHYTLVGVSDEGARNISFQGMRCATREYKTYDYGRPDGSWSESRNAAWLRVPEAEGNRELAALYKEILCKDGFPLNLKQVLDRLHTNPYASIPY
jgi:hypothetical protein